MTTDGRIDGTFVAIEFKDGTKHTAMMPLADIKPPTESRRISPPIRERKDLALAYAKAILGPGIPGLYGLGLDMEQVEMYAVGSESIMCRKCDTFNPYYFETCGKCGAEIRQPMQMHSNVSYQGYNKTWRVILARDITQSKTVKKCMKVVSPLYNLEFVDERWVTIVNICYLLAPVAYLRVHKIDPAKFHIAQWSGVTSQGEDKRIKFAKSLLRRYGGIISVI